MRKISQRLPAALSLALAGALGLTVTASAQEEAQPEQEQQEEEITCRATVAPASIVSQAEPVVVQVTFSEEIGTTKEVEPQTESGLEVIKVEKPEELEKVAEIETETEGEEGFEEAAQRPAYDVQVRLNAENAEHGQWTLAFEGTEGNCIGTLQIAEMEQPEPPQEGGEPPLR